MPSARAVLARILAGLLAPAWVDAAGCSGATIRTAIAATAAPWSRLPPTGREPAEVPQIVTITFNDNFGVALPGSVGGVGAIVDAYAARRNPAGKGIATDFDGGPIRATFFSSSIYMTESSEFSVAVAARTRAAATARLGRPPSRQGTKWPITRSTTSMAARPP